MGEKRILISNIMNCLLSTTESNFQNKMSTILYIICKKEFGFDFEKVHPTNGDGKNDGWIPQKNVFFAMYSPSDSKISQISQINAKLNSDLDGLCNNLYNEGMWNKELSEFYLLVNTHDQDLPADPKMLLNNTIESIRNKYNKSFKVKVLAAKDLKLSLFEFSLETIQLIAENLDVYSIISDFNISDIFEFVDEYNTYLVITNIPKNETSYSRLTIERKIEFNDLSEKKEYILNLIEASDKIDSYLNFVNSEGIGNEKYINLKNYIVEKYNELKDKYSGKDLYTNLLDVLLYDGLPNAYVRILEAIIVNIFIKCDIFEKGDINDFAE